MSLENRLGSTYYGERFYQINEKLRVLKIGTDIDGTEIDSFTSALNIINKAYGTDFKITDLTYDFAIVDLVREHIPSISDPRMYCIATFNGDKNLGSAEPNSGSLLISRFLHEDGVDSIHRISSRPTFTRFVTYAWYESHMPWVDPGLIHIQNGGREINPNFKVEEIEREGIEWFWEDVPGHAEKIVKATKSNVILVPRPWNEKYVPIDDRRIFTISPGYFPRQPLGLRLYMKQGDLLLGS